MIGGLETVVLLPAASVDRYGKPVPGTGDPVPVEDVLVSPGPSPESTSRDRDGASVAMTLYFPAGTVLDRLQAVEVRGHEYQVAGEPAVWTPGRVAPGQVVVELERAEG